MLESEVQRGIRLALGRVPGLCLARNNVGLDRSAARPVRYGLGPGSPDLVGSLTLAGEKPVALAMAIEVKASGGRVRPEQLRWHNQARERGIAVFVCRSHEEAISSIKGWLITLIHIGYKPRRDTLDFFGIGNTL